MQVIVLPIQNDVDMSSTCLRNCFVKYLRIFPLTLIFIITPAKADIFNEESFTIGMVVMPQTEENASKSHQIIHSDHIQPSTFSNPVIIDSGYEYKRRSRESIKTDTMKCEVIA